MMAQLTLARHAAEHHHVITSSRSRRVARHAAYVITFTAER
jgi:hypothetical protein